jgi:hypothetical protein
MLHHGVGAGGETGERNRRVAVALGALLAVLYCLAIVGVIVLN